MNSKSAFNLAVYDISKKTRQRIPFLKQIKTEHETCVKIILFLSAAVLKKFRKFKLVAVVTAITATVADVKT